MNDTTTGREHAAPTQTGIAGLDHILRGGLPAYRLYLVEGTPGTGKTTLALNFLLEGRKRGETGLYITLSETADELHSVAHSHGWSLDDIDLFELVAENEFSIENEQSLLHPSEVELGETVAGIIEQVERIDPARVVLDSLSELRLLSQSALRYRRQILALKHFFAKRDCTVLMLDDRTSEPGDLQLHSIAHGVVSLEQSASAFGSERRRLRVIKMRGLKYRGGYHDFTIEQGGLCVYPRLIASEHHAEFDPAPVSTGLAGLDRLLGNGLVPGTNTLITGPAGVGKTTTAVKCLVAALERGARAAYYLFDERLATLLQRSAALGMDLRPYLENGQLTLRQIDPAELSPGEFSGSVQEAVETDGASMVVIDSLNAYMHSMPSDNFLVLQMHELLSYLSQQGIISLMILGQHGVLGDLRSELDISYLADTVMLMRFFEAEGTVRKSVSVIKTRTSDHERTIREFDINASGLTIGEPLTGFAGVLSGNPNYIPGNDKLLKDA
ncbi:gas vesicle protein GvpD [Qipengyuania sp. DY56-A-20]|jgi:circadian clock protein KaiC|uniref:non-specific serine/threonine protein kinase n=1 Tax=Qipengyuania benthica TaxID=3067651 RepID=A0ABT9H9E6_9SPHN|nr:ATPase domain-containing protein [Qipengyuania sp. DY56-A-20]MDP4539941.1 gas vesicle protein GvpD [Qipengyuania sp. DY56-A-20]